MKIKRKQKAGVAFLLGLMVMFCFIAYTFKPSEVTLATEVKLRTFEVLNQDDSLTDDGNPQDVRDYLQLLANRNRLLAISLKDDICDLNKIVAENFRLQQESYEEYLQEKRMRTSGCTGCPYGNGEGGCTIGGCTRTE